MPTKHTKPDQLAIAGIIIVDFDGELVSIFNSMP